MPTVDAPVVLVVAVPPLDDFDYQVQGFIETDSKMSSVLLATSGKQHPFVLKIAQVDQRARAEANRQAIQNTVLWLRRLGLHDGLVRLYPVAFKPGDGRARAQAPVYCATLRQWPGQPEFLVMEYLAGGSLREYVGARPLSIAVALSIAYHLAESLAYIHQHGCVHRDVKPENILFRSSPAGSNRLALARPVLVDFGVAAARGEPKFVSGSRLWMAPELQEAYEQSPLPVDPAWDVYALGLILCYMLTGRHPRRKSYEYASVLAYRDRTLAAVEQQLGPGQQHEFSSVNTRLQQLITAMLAREPANRPGAQAVAGATAALLADLGAPLPAAAWLRMPFGRSWRLPHGKRLQLALASALVVGVLLGSLAGLLVTWPSPAGALDNGAQDVASPPPTQVDAFQGQRMPSGALSPAPTLVPLTPAAVQPPPTLVPLPSTVTSPPPTLVSFTPAPQATATATQPAVIPPTPTQTLVNNSVNDSLAVSATRPNPARPNLTPNPTAPVPATTVPVLAQVELLAPESGTRSDQGKVEFSWRASAQPAADHCFELVFWQPDKAGDKRSPVGAGKATRRRVDFTFLVNSSDHLLHTLAQSDRDFNWGVRIVSCAAPRTVLQDVQQVRVYSYKGQ